jgi:hypothetical protein
MSQLTHQSKNSGGFENQMIGVVMGLNPPPPEKYGLGDILDYYGNYELI